MDDELKRIQLETAKLQLEREKLALQSERDRVTRNALIADSTREIVQGTTAVGAAAVGVSAWLLKALLTIIFRVTGWGLMSLLVCLAIVIFFREDFPGDIQFKLGYFLGSGGWMIIVIGIVVGLLLPRKTSAPQSAATEQAPMARPASSATNSQTTVGSWVGTKKDWRDWRAQGGISKFFVSLVGMAALGFLIAAIERILK